MLVSLRISGTRSLNHHTSLYLLTCNVRLFTPNVELKPGSQKAFMFFLLVSSLCDNYSQADSTAREEGQRTRRADSISWPLFLNKIKRNTVRLNMVIFPEINQRFPAFRGRVIQEKNDYIGKQSLFVTLTHLLLLPSFCLRQHQQPITNYHGKLNNWQQ